MLAMPPTARPPRDPIRYPVEDFFATVAWYDASFSRDGRRVLVSGNPTGVFNVHAIAVDGGEPEALTASTTDATYAVCYFRTDDRVLFTADRGGDERHHLYVRELDGRVHDLTPGDALKAGFAGWSRTGDRFFVTTNERDARAFDVYAYEATGSAVDGYARTLLYRNDGAFRPAAVSPDGRFVALERSVGVSDADVYLYDGATGRTEHLTPHAGVVAHGVAGFDADGSGLYLTTDEASEFTHLDRIDLATRARTTVFAPPWDVLFAAVSPDGAHLAVGVNADARTELHLFALPSMRSVPAPAVPEASVTRVVFSDDGRLVAFYANASRAPGDLYVAAVATDAPPRRLTRSLDPRIDPADLVDGEVSRFASYDGLEVPGVLYLPHGASPDAPVPAVVRVHGGPGGQARIGWDPVAQYLVNHGYAVYDVNNRGSSGYGKSFYGLDVRRHGEADLGDVVAARGLLEGTRVVDPARVAVMGASYGGFLVLAALTQHPTAFAAGVDLFGPSSWLRTIESLPVWLGAQRDALLAKLGDPATDADRLRRVSPVFHADRIRRPLLVLQGANDPRVLQRESDEIVEAARANGVPVEYLVFPDEGHGFARRDNLLRGYGAVLAFLERYVRGG
ncbi:MAG TPA: S9 family peptidase [Gemmatirosa sp.]